jgi:multimeric flavodoxin WrbA
MTGSPSSASGLRAVAINCTLKPAPDESSCDRLIGLVSDELAKHDVATATIRAVDLDIKPGVTSDEGDGDDWPPVRQQILDAQILLIATPIWLGNPSSVCRRVLERLDAFLGETDDQGRMISFDRVGIAATVGNEDGAHAVSAQVFQALGDVGFTIPAGGHAYWVGEAMGSVDFKDLDEVPESVSDAVATMSANAAHLARLLAGSGYPST